MENSVSIILPTFNESMNIRQMVKRLNKSVKNIKEILVIDDNSPDNTAGIAAKLENVKVITRKNQRGVGGAILRGIQLAKGDIIAWMDADLSMPPEVVPKLVAALEASDVAVGSRYIKGGKDKRRLLRVITSRCINLFANLVLNYNVLDYDSGFVAAKKEVFNKVKFNPQGHGEYCIEFLYKSARKGFKIKEVPYVFTERRLGESKTTEYIFSISKYGLMYVLRILKIRLKKSL
jgi:dolichol-phosphate mannosyltransferase